MNVLLFRVGSGLMMMLSSCLVVSHPINVGCGRLHESNWCFSTFDTIFFFRERDIKTEMVYVWVCGLSISNVISKSILLTISQFLLNLLYIVACEFVVEKLLWMRSVNANFPDIPIGNIKSSKLLLEFQSKAFRLNFCTHVNYIRIKYCKLTRIRSYVDNKHFWFIQ